MPLGGHFPESLDGNPEFDQQLVRSWRAGKSTPIPRSVIIHAGHWSIVVKMSNDGRPVRQWLAKKVDFTFGTAAQHGAQSPLGISTSRKYLLMDEILDSCIVTGIPARRRMKIGRKMVRTRHKFNEWGGRRAECEVEEEACFAEMKASGSRLSSASARTMQTERSGTSGGA